MKTTRALIALLAGLAFASVALGGAPPPERDAALQARLAAVVSAAVEASGTAEERIEELESAAGDRRGALLLQLAFFLSDSDSTEESMIGAVLFHRLEFTAAEKLSALLPHLETEDVSLRKSLTDLMSTIDRPDGAAPDFGFYEAYLRGKQPAGSGALIRYMYRVSPEIARASMERVFGNEAAIRPDAASRKELESLITRHDTVRPWSDEDLTRGRTILDRLSRDPSWWLRLYVAATLEKAPNLETPSLRARLENDPEKLVRSILR